MLLVWPLCAEYHLSPKTKQRFELSVETAAVASPHYCVNANTENFCLVFTNCCYWLSGNFLLMIDCWINSNVTASTARLCNLVKAITVDYNLNMPRGYPLRGLLYFYQVPSINQALFSMVYLCKHINNVVVSI